VRHRLGVGDNPGFETGAQPFPAAARYLEAGLSLLSAAPAFAAGAELLLHLSRGPFCETAERQDLESYLAHLRAHVRVLAPLAVSDLDHDAVGQVPVVVSIGETEFTTAMWPRDGRNVVPIKVAVQRSEQIRVGARVRVRLGVAGRS
jgi:hypothetical protein